MSKRNKLKESRKSTRKENPRDLGNARRTIRRKTIF
jgi:hypothetical protein